VQRHILREKGIVIVGLSLLKLIDPTSPNDLRQAVADVLPLWVNPFLENPMEHIKSRGYQSYIVLSLCRMLYTLQLGDVASKPAAAKWAMQTLESHWTPLIERAIIGRQNARLEIEPDDLNGTLDLIRYTLAQIKPTPYIEVNQVLNLLHSSAKEILGNQFVGMYLYGSLAYGDFNPESSDIDFLFVTTDSLSEKTIAELEEMHKRTWATSLKRAGKLEGAYVPKKLIRKHDPNGEKCPTINEGEFYLDELGTDWIIQRHVIREYSVALEGPDPKTLIDFVTPEDIRGSVLGVVREWWFPMLEDASWLREHDSGYHSFAVITMCRVLHALEHGTIVSKPKAIQWARKKLDEKWNQLIDEAVAASEHKEHEEFLDETLDFISYIKSFVGENYDHIS
jgi:predicted nucleotidyltransferase